MSGVSVTDARERRRGRFAEDLTGRTFGLLTVTQRSPKNGQRGEARWVCRCACNRLHVVLGRHLRAGSITSCGCRGGAVAPRVERAPAVPRGPRPTLAPVVPPPPPPSQPRLVARMLPIYLETSAHGCDRTPRHGERAEATRVALAWGVERRDDCTSYDDCLGRVPMVALDARCPRVCPGYVATVRRVEEYGGWLATD